MTLQVGGSGPARVDGVIVSMVGLRALRSNQRARYFASWTPHEQGALDERHVSPSCQVAYSLPGSDVITCARVPVDSDSIMRPSTKPE